MTTIRLLTESGNNLAKEDGSLLLTEALAADLSSVATLESALTDGITVAAVLSAESSFVGDIEVIKGFVAEILTESSLAADLTNTISVSTELTAESTCAFDLSTTIELAAALESSSESFAELTNEILAQTDLVSESSLNSDLSTEITLEAIASSQANAEGDISTSILAAAELAVDSTISADLYTEIDLFSAYISESNLVSADLSASINAEAQLQAEQTLEGLLGSMVYTDASIASDAQLSANLTAQITLAAAVAAVAEASAVLDTEIRLEATVSVSSALTADLTTVISLASQPAVESSLNSGVTTSILAAAELNSNPVFAAELNTSINALTALISVANIVDASLLVYRIDPAYSPRSDQIYLAELQAYDPATSSVVTWRFSSGTGYSNGSVFYAPRIEQPATFSRSMSGGIGGRTSTSYGELTLINNDGGLNALADDYFDGRTLTLKRGSASQPYSSFSTLLVATVETVAMERERVSVRLRDKTISLDTPFSTVKYAGNNVLPAGIEGTADDIKDNYKPRIFGRIALMQPVLVNTSKLIYQVNNGSVDAVLNVFDAGAYLSKGTDYASQADMEANAPTSGYWRAWPAGGCFRIGSSPYGQISVSVAEKWDYTQNSAAGLIQRILIEKGFTSADWVASDFSVLNQKNVAGLGILVEDGETTGALIDRICQSVGAWWGFDALGKFRVARFDAPAGTPVATITNNEILELERQPESQMPLYRATVQADKNYSVTDKKSLAGIVPDNRSNWISQSTRDQKAENVSVKTARLLAEEASFESDLNGIAIAAAESARRLSLYSSRRDVVTLTIADPASRYSTLDLGSVVSIKTNRLGYEAGRLMTVTSVQANYQTSEMDLTLWG